MLKDYLAISGQPGLFKFISDARNGIIVESLLTGKRMHVSAAAQVSSLEDIAVYTETEDLPLREVLKKILEKEEGGPSINHKSDPETLRFYFRTILPEYDPSRVYVSDIKKVIQWYNILQEKELLNFKEEKAKEEEKTKKEEKTEKAEEKKNQ